MSRRPAVRPALVAVIAAGAGAALAVAVGASRLAASGEPERTGAAVALTARAASPAEAALVRRARRLAGVRPRDLGYRLVLRGPRPGVRGATDRARRTITLYVDAAQAAHRVAHDLAHEIGHAYDDRRMDAAARAAWLRARGAAGVPWFPGGPGSDYETGAGDFAEVFARCHAASSEFRSRVAPPPADACAVLPAGARRLDFRGRG